MQGTDTDASRLLVVDDEKNMRHMLSVLLTKAGYAVDCVSNGLEALDKLAVQAYDFILCDLKMPNMDGMTFLKKLREKPDTTTVIIMSAYGTIDTALEAMKLGAYDYISKPFKTDEVLLALKKAEEREHLKRENRLLREHIKKIQENYTFDQMVAKSKAMQSVFELSEKAAQYDTTVLILGESGTGKELVARGIHSVGKRASKPFVAINCGGIPENLLESELFGYVKGAFTGADKNKKGLFEEADGGTIFLDEIFELPLQLQVKLLRVLQENEIRAIGDSRTRVIDVRVVAATSRNLTDEVKGGGFREDLFYRLNVVPIVLPPLRTRPEDIPVLCRHIINKLNLRLGKSITGIASGAMARLINHPWPGNVRELENVLERAAVLSESEILEPELFSIEQQMQVEPKGEAEEISACSLKSAQKELEKRFILHALRKTRGNRTQAARLLGISHPCLLSKMKIYDISL